MHLQIKFPSSYGYTLPTKEKVKALQTIYGFSNDYAQFLLFQNGFIEHEFCGSGSGSMRVGEYNENYWQELRALYGIADTEEYYELKESQEGNIFNGIFFLIGCDHGGNQFVEVLCGDKKGWIGLIDHDAYITYDSLEDFLLEREEWDEALVNKVKNKTYPLENIANALVSEDVDLMKLYSSSIIEFTQNCMVLADESIAEEDLQIKTKYEPTSQNLRNIINCKIVPQNDINGFKFEIEDAEIIIRKPCTNKDGVELGNSIYIEQNGLILFLTPDGDNILVMYQEEGEERFKTLNNRSPYYVKTRSTILWLKVAIKMQRHSPVIRAILKVSNYQEFEKQFGEFVVPDDLKRLWEFAYEFPSEWFSEGFEFRTSDKTGLETWSVNETFLTSFIEFAGANSTGSTYAFWVINHDLSQCPIIVFGDEGGIFPVAENIRQLIHLLTYDAEIMVNMDAVNFYREEDDEYEPSEQINAYLKWVKQNFGLKQIQNSEEIDAILAIVIAKYDDDLTKFLKEHTSIYDENNNEEEISVKETINEAYHKYESKFGGYPIPEALKKLWHFEYQSLGKAYSQFFSIAYRANKPDYFLTLSNNKTFQKSFIEFGGREGGGSTYTFWFINADLNQCPIVVFRGDGGILVLAENILQLIQLQTYDYDNPDDKISERNEEFVQWAAENLAVKPIENAEETETIIVNAQQKYQGKLNDFLEKYAGIIKRIAYSETLSTTENDIQDDALQVTENGVDYKNELFTFPVDIAVLKNLLGECRHLHTKYMNAYIWDNLGCTAYTPPKDENKVESITFFYDLTKRYSHTPEEICTIPVFINKMNYKAYLAEIKLGTEKHQKSFETLSPFINNTELLFIIEEGRIESLTLSEHKAPPPKVYSDKYKFQKIDGEKIEFADFNFKLAIIQVLMYEMEVLLPKFDLYEFVKNYKEREIDIEEEGYDFIPEVTNYFQQLEIDKKYADEITELFQDGGDDIYGELFRFWDGEGDEFTIQSVEDTKHFSNLKKISLFGSVALGGVDKKIVEELKAKGIDVEEG